MRSRAFQLKTKEAHTTPNFISGMYLLLIFLFMLFIMLICMCCCLGSFFMNNILVLVLFNLGATRSFASLALSKRFDDVLGELDYPLEVEIVDDCSVRVLRVH